ncbi:hypothetical protein [Streptomyces virginiae]|uniref:hypothetical protein n=1 Tax=Streptomyces virginiae TaxID=1961 RepID=UPI00225BDC98|nr:hypothetical protein [Streptomyces virginiae]MCX4721895.1 hypothetical protein [Streptomyces virginiae]MCX5276814.1 hypothetical protein [Streptomyces virginiae]
MTMRVPPIDREKSPLTALDEEAARLADLLEAHPDTTDVTDSGTRGDIGFTTAGDTWVLDFQAGADDNVFQETTAAPAPAEDPAADVLRDVVVPALLAHPAYRTATAEGDTLTIHLATGRHYTLALSPAA